MIEEVNAQIKRFSGLTFQWLGFPQPLEKRFEADTAPRRSSRLALEGLIAITLFDLFLFADRLISAREFHLSLLLRLAIITPLSLCFNFYLWRNPGKVVREAGIALITCLGGLAHLYIESGQSAVNSAYALVGLLTIVVYANTSVRLRFPYALAMSGSLTAGEILFLRASRFLLPNQKLIGLALTLLTIAVTLIGNYSSNREERLNYLLALRGDLLVDDLHKSNELLADVAETDGLTGLTNRAGFETRFERLWKSSLASKTAFSVIMVDVDHFKRTNDNYGHLYGDKVLKRIAHLVLEALRKEDDHAARFGGEEFVILLPNTEEPAAMLVAERLRRLVEVAGFPPIDLSRHRFYTTTATVSCGVATAVPQYIEERHHLINAADAALYEAKATGRNRVCCSPYKAPPLYPKLSVPKDTIATAG